MGMGSSVVGSELLPWEVKGTPRASSESQVTLCLWDSYYVVGKGLTKLDLGVVSKTTLIGSVTLSKSLNFSGHQFPHVYDRVMLSACLLLGMI